MRERKCLSQNKKKTAEAVFSIPGGVFQAEMAARSSA